MSEGRVYEAPSTSQRRSAPAALRNRGPIADVLEEWLPPSGKVLEVASGTGEHVLFFAESFPHLTWQPSDRDPLAVASIEAWRAVAGLDNIRPAVQLDAARWPEGMAADAILCINMAHISPWEATLGLLDNAARLLPDGGPLIFYGPWLAKDVETAASNVDFDLSLKSRNPDWGIRHVEALAAAASSRGLQLKQRKPMPANNVMLLMRREPRRR
jgi:SAM-dependent methyltransferase